jgi:hypothetical protein
MKRRHLKETCLESTSCYLWKKKTYPPVKRSWKSLLATCRIQNPFLGGPTGLLSMIMEFIRNPLGFKDNSVEEESYYDGFRMF